MKPFQILIAALLLISTSNAQDSMGIYLIGHSLTHNLDKMIDQISEDGGHETHVGSHAPPGSPVKANWENPNYQYGTPAWPEAVAGGTFDYVVITEALELRSNAYWNEGAKHMALFHDTFTVVNPEVETIVYQTWHCVETVGCSYDDTGVDFSAEVDDYLGDWEEIADSLAAFTEQENVRIIPGGIAFKLLNDSLAAGTIPGHTELTDFFSDNIHYNNAGAYLIASTFFATIYKETPVGRTTTIASDSWGNFYDFGVENEVLLKLQEIAWQAVCSYERTSVSCDQATNALETSLNLSHQSKLIRGSFTVEAHKEWQVFTLNGKLIKSGFTRDQPENIELGQSNLYYLRID
jgi:hypothetical protein